MTRFTYAGEAGEFLRCYGWSGLDCGAAVLLFRLPQAGCRTACFYVRRDTGGLWFLSWLSCDYLSRRDLEVISVQLHRDELPQFDPRITLDHDLRTRVCAKLQAALAAKLRHRSARRSRTRLETARSELNRLSCNA